MGCLKRWVRENLGERCGRIGEQPGDKSRSALFNSLHATKGRPERTSNMSRYGSNLTPSSTPSKLASKSQRSRARREPSGVFTLFQPPQVQQFKEAFSLIDQDGDGIVTEEDLKRIFASLGMHIVPAAALDSGYTSSDHHLLNRYYTNAA